MTFTRHVIIATAALTAISAAAGPAFAQWPERPVTLIAVAGAGGGSDYTMRLLARELEENTGQPFTVVNQAQGGGIVGYTSYSSAKKDGYTLGQLSPFAQFRLLGQADFTAESFTPIAQFNADPAAVHVAADSKLQSINDIIAALKADPESLKISCGGTCSASWDIPFVSLMLEEGIDVAKLNLIPAQGSAAALQELASGGMDVVLCSVPETDSLTSAGLVKTVAVLNDTRLEKYPDVPTVEEETGKAVAGGTWRGIAGPAGMDPALVAEIEAELKKAFDSERFQSGMKDRGFGAVWLGTDAFSAFVEKHEEQTQRVMDALGTSAAAQK
ncbi:tripartite tricarboxylate transporter substrate binding protein [Chelativorans sp. AA-79]|uniref:Bug family tripartite tricarboxylate transporter substrate binding protein n=1 Tax=Chelativorans sp. AA-79 TaxID=3028735 RepID=UPI0023FA22E7|nr:tripartite tricarboxylate transporter substrate binding protein [Chelativorans sp. AA-79]WEX11029.1 tripartite tricarboxylate transporter substrate binding protein [Chelativorans sp. AA-79]